MEAIRVFGADRIRSGKMKVRGKEVKFRQLAVPHYRNAVTELENLFQTMRNIDGRTAVSHLIVFLIHIGFRNRIEPLA